MLWEGFLACLVPPSLHAKTVSFATDHSDTWGMMQPVMHRLHWHDAGPKRRNTTKRSQILSQNDDDSSHIDVAFVNLSKLELNESFVCNMLQNIFQCLPTLMSHKVLVPGFLAFLLLLIEVPTEIWKWVWCYERGGYQSCIIFFVYFMCVFLNFWWRGHPGCHQQLSLVLGLYCSFLCSGYTSL